MLGEFLAVSVLSGFMQIVLILEMKNFTIGVQRQQRESDRRLSRQQEVEEEREHERFPCGECQRLQGSML